jgi:hypothetical protein
MVAPPDGGSADNSDRPVAADASIVADVADASSDAADADADATDAHRPRLSAVEYRRIPVLSEIMYFPVILWSASLHYALRPWPKLEATIAMLVLGGFFAFLLIPIGFALLVTMLLQWTMGIPALATWWYVWLPFAILYATSILWLDDAHRVVRNSGSTPPRYGLEVAAWAFADSVWNYYPNVECIPWKHDAILPPNDRQYIFGVHPHGIHCIPLGQFVTKNGAFDRCSPVCRGRN